MVGCGDGEVEEHTPEKFRILIHRGVRGPEDRALALALAPRLLRGLGEAALEHVAHALGVVLYSSSSSLLTDFFFLRRRFFGAEGGASEEPAALRL